MEGSPAGQLERAREQARTDLAEGYAHDLIDQLTILTFPVILGRGKRLFDETSRPHAWTLESSDTSTTGVIVARYRRAGEVPTGSFAAEPSAAELRRRERWAREG